MANTTDPIVAYPQQNWAMIMVWHTFYGIFFWEFFTTLDYEWKVICGRIPYRWTIWVYSVTRAACLMNLILSAVDLNVTAPINCQLLISFRVFTLYLSFGAASLLIVLRITAIWNRNKIAVAVAISVWAINIAFFIQGAVRLRAVWVPPMDSCGLPNAPSNKPTLISMAVTDIVLLLIMLVGLLRLRQGSCGTFGLAQFLWKQGLIWILIATAVEVPSAVSAIVNSKVRPTVVTFLLSLGAPLFQMPTIVTMTIASTRMHRSLVDFATSDVNDNFQTSSLKLPNTKQVFTTPIPLNPTKLRIIFQKHHHGLSTITNKEIHVPQEPNRSALDEDVERGECGEQNRPLSIS